MRVRTLPRSCAGRFGVTRTAALMSAKPNGCECAIQREQERAILRAGSAAAMVQPTTARATRATIPRRLHARHHVAEPRRNHAHRHAAAEAHVRDAVQQRAVPEHQGLGNYELLRLPAGQRVLEVRRQDRRVQGHAAALLPRPAPGDVAGVMPAYPPPAPPRRRCRLCVGASALAPERWRRRGGAPPAARPRPERPRRNCMASRPPPEPTSTHAPCTYTHNHIHFPLPAGSPNTSTPASESRAPAPASREPRGPRATAAAASWRRAALRAARPPPRCFGARPALIAQLRLLTQPLPMPA